MEFHVYKYSGAGNTFIILQGQLIPHDQRVAFVQKISNPVFGANTDGVLFIDEGDEHCDYRWDFYNKDGSLAEMCGNASRCAAKFVHDQLKNPKLKIQFLTLAGLVTTEIKENLIYVEMPSIKLHEVNKLVKTKSAPQGCVGFWMDTGVPHFVIHQDIKNGFQHLKEISSELRHHEDFGHSGSNITFVQNIVGNHYRAATFERGVEDFTLACGTGAVAAAVAMQGLSKDSESRIQMPGGEIGILLGLGKRPIMFGQAEKILDIVCQSDEILRPS